MGGSFFAQSADLHSVWCTYTQRHLFRALGDLRITSEGYPHWQGEYVTALCPFRDNIILGTDAAPHAHVHLINHCEENFTEIMQPVRRL